MEQILSQPSIDKVVLPAGMSGQVLPFLPLGPNNTSMMNKSAQSGSANQQNTVMLDSTSNNLQSRPTARGGR